MENLFNDKVVVIANDEKYLFEDLTTGYLSETYKVRKAIWFDGGNTYKVYNADSGNIREMPIEGDWYKTFIICSEDADIVLEYGEPAIINNWRREDEIENRLAEIEKIDNADVKFWDFVKHINWPKNKHKSPDELYEKGLKFCNGNVDTMKKMEEIAIEYTELLYDIFFADWINGYINESDDGWEYLRTHIVGMGEEAYMKHLHNMKLIHERANRLNYTEGFAYIFRKLW